MAGSALTDAAEAISSDFDERFALMRPRLLAIGTSLAGPDAADEIVQDTYLRGRSKIRQLRDPSAFDRGTFPTSFQDHLVQPSVDRDALC